MKYFLNKTGSMLAVSALGVFLLVCVVLWINQIYVSGSKLIEEQNKKDAHILSVIGLYADTMDDVSWANKQLKRITILSSMLVFAPQLSGLVKMLDVACAGLKKYQDLLLIKLKTYAPVLDRKLRYQNGLPLIGNLHYVSYRRQPSVELVFMTIPGLIEFQKDIFDTACVKHKGKLVSSLGCLYSDDYIEQKELWFAPTKSSWVAKIKNAY